MRSLLTFGRNLTLFNVLSAVNHNVDRMLIGYRWGPAAVGLYAKGFQLVALTHQQIFFPIARVAVPTLSRLVHEPQRYERYYCKLIGFVAYASLPTVVVLGVAAEATIEIVLGSQWTESAPILQILCIAFFGRAAIESTNWVAISTGNTRRMIAWSLISTPLLCVAFLLGVRWGGIGVAWAYAVGIHSVGAFKFWFFLEDAPVSKMAALRAVQVPVVISVIMLPCICYVRELVLGQPPLVVCLAVGFAAVAFYGLSLMAWPRAYREVSDLLTNVKMLRQRPDPTEVTS